MAGTPALTLAVVVNNFSKKKPENWGLWANDIFSGLNSFGACVKGGQFSHVLFKPPLHVGWG